MPQESWRYRSFVTCDDPKGVVECKTIRKSKTSSSKMEHEKNPRTSSAEKVRMDVTERKCHNPSSFQLMEVSNGAKKLNRLIDLWSNGDSYNGQSKDLGNDLLKGAIDLQESLTMLGKLQEASQYMALLKRSQKVKKSERKIDRACSDRFSNQSCQAEFQKPRHSADGYSILHRRVSRRSFAGYDFFPNRDDVLFHRRNVELASEMPSTSSNQSYSNTFGSIESSPSSSDPQEKANPPNLIARLMGLEELPTTTLQLQTSPKKQTKTETIMDQRRFIDMNREKIVNQKRHIFDIDKANIRKPQYLPLKEDQKKKTLREILETAQLKGLIKRNSFKESKYLSHCKDSSIENSRPIVLIKPIYAPYSESDERLAPRFQKESTDMMVGIGKLSTNEDPPSKLIEISEVGFNDKNMHGETEAGEKFKFVKRPSQNKAAKNHKEREKSEERGPKIKANHSKVLVSKPEEKGSKSKPKSSDRVKVSQQQKKVAGEKKVDCNKKVQNSKTTTRFKNISIDQDQAKATPAKPRKPETISDMSKNQTSPQRNTTSPSNSRKPSTVTRKSSEQKKSLVKKEKPVCEPVASKQDGENLGCKKEDSTVEHIREVELVDKMIDICFEGGSVKLENEVPLKAEASEVYFEESRDDFESVVPNDISDLHSEEVNNHVIQSQSVKTSSITRAFLSNSPSLLTLADEYFDLTVQTPTTFCNKTDLGLKNEKLTMDYAKELMERRSLPDLSTVHSVSFSLYCNRKLCISLDQLLDEVSAGLETLASYSKAADGGLYADSLYSMLERDLWGNAVVYGIWDMSWRKGFSVDMAEQVVIDMEMLIFSGLIEEIFT